MGINKENYKAYFLDYQEGNLAPEQVAELMIFLEVYPELKEELEAFELVFVEPEPDIRMKNKSFLKKKSYVPTQSINSNNYEEWLVAEVEGDLSLHGKSELNDFLKKNPDARLELNVFRKTVLKPASIEYDNKESLKKRGVFLLYSREIIYATSFAASILLFLGLYFMGDFYPENRMADMEWKLNMQSRRVSNLNIDKKFLKNIELTSNNKFVSPENTFEKNEIVSNDEISHISSIRFTSSVQIEENDIYYIDYKYGAAFAINFMGPEMLPKTEKKSFIGRFLSSSVAKLVPARNSSGKSILEYSVDGFNLLADREVEVEKQYDTDGNVVYNVNGEIINFSRKVKSSPQN